MGAAARLNLRGLVGLKAESGRRKVLVTSAAGEVRHGVAEDGLALSQRLRLRRACGARGKKAGNVWSADLFGAGLLEHEHSSPIDAVFISF